MKPGKSSFAVFGVALVLVATTPLFSQGDFNQESGNAIVTVLPQQKGVGALAISANQLTLRVNGKPATISRWKRLQVSDAPIQLIVMIDDGARETLSNQLGDIAQFVKNLPPDAEAAIAYMDNGRAVMAGPLSKDHTAVARELRVPTGPAGISGSPYFCLSDLAHDWPSQDRAVRRIVVMLTDGVDNYEVRYNPEDPYLQAAIHDAVRSRISVYSIYWRSRGFSGRSMYAASDGQNLLSQLCEATGGYSYWQGIGDPVSLQPYFKNLDRRLHNQYDLSFTVPLPEGPRVVNLSLHASGSSARLIAPQQVYVGHPAQGQQHGAQGD